VIRSVMVEETMSIGTLLSEMPGWYWYYTAMILFSLYYAVRGVVYESYINEEAPFSIRGRTKLDAYLMGV
jgi:hypothetical protein